MIKEIGVICKQYREDEVQTVAIVNSFTIICLKMTASNGVDVFVHKVLAKNNLVNMPVMVSMQILSQTSSTGINRGIDAL